MPPRISIVIPTWNRLPLLRDTIASVRAQDETSWECLVVDDSSEDGTAAWLDSAAADDPRIRPLSKPAGAPRGPAASRNFGLSRARGNHVLFFDSDDLLPPGFLREALDRIEANRSDALLCRIRFFTGDPAEGGRLSAPIVLDDLLGRAVACELDLFTQNVVWRRGFLDGIAGFREDLTMVEDLEFAVRALCRTDRILAADDLEVLVRRHSASLTFDPSPRRHEQRNLHMFDAYSSIVATLRGHGLLSARARRWACHRRYELLVQLLKAGRVSFPLAARYLHLVARLAIEGNVRFLSRLVLLMPALWSLGAIRSFRPRDPHTPPPG